MIFSKLPLFLAGAIALTASAAQFEGYIMDNQCVDLCRETTSDTPCTPDTSNAFYSPQRHTGWCLQLQVCIDSGYSLMSLEPDESGKHSILMAFAGDESQQAVLDYVKAGPQGQFPRVVVSYNETSVDLESDADSIPQIFEAVISDPWDYDVDVYSGEDTSQKVCSDASDADIDSNNYCMRSDVMVKAGSNGMIVIESNGCPDHDNMMGGSGLISTTQKEPAFDGGKGVTSSCASGCCGGCCTSCAAKEGASCCASSCSTTCAAKECNSCCASGCCGSSTTCSAEEGTSCCASGCGDSSTTCAAEKGDSCSASGCGGSSTTCAAEEGDSCSASGCGGSSTTCSAEEGTSCSASGCGGSSTTCSADKGTSCCASGSCGANRDRELECASSCASSCAAKLGACSATPGCGGGACGGGCGGEACGVGCGVGSCGGACGVCAGTACGAKCGCGGCGDGGCACHSHPKIGTYDPVFHHYTMMIPSEPGAPGEVTALTDEVVGMMANGVLLDAHKQTWSYDMCGGHSDKKHQYHYHMPPICYLKSMGVEFADEHSWWIDEDEVRDFADMKNMFSETASPSPVVGFALDGFPIYGPYDSAGNRMSSATYGGDVDQCNGKEDSDGNYGYYLTVDPPFAPPCLRGNKGAFTYSATDKVCPREGISNTILGLPDPETKLEETSEEEMGVGDSSGNIAHALASLFVTLMASVTLV